MRGVANAVNAASVASTVGEDLGVDKGVGGGDEENGCD